MVQQWFSNGSPHPRMLAYSLLEARLRAVASTTDWGAPPPPWEDPKGLPLGVENGCSKSSFG